MAGIRFEGMDQIPVYNPETQETNVSGVYIAGVACGGLNTSLWFIENARSHAVSISKSICRK
ncbi:hypothetical protein QLX67_06330, partial [Balneolaceae bacterium ANBcel3]|nr:hypothetical protein [Balneolaceae bacterium ANBcel3]